MSSQKQCLSLELEYMDSVKRPKISRIAFKLWTVYCAKHVVLFP